MCQDPNPGPAALRMMALRTEHPPPFRRHMVLVLFYTRKFQLANIIVSGVTYDIKETQKS